MCDIAPKLQKQYKYKCIHEYIKHLNIMRFFRSQTNINKKVINNQGTIAKTYSKCYKLFIYLMRIKQKGCEIGRDTNKMKAMLSL